MKNKILFSSLVLLFLTSFIQNSIGQSINVSILGDAIVGDSVTIEVTAEHPSGIRRLWLIQDNDYLNKTEETFGGGVTNATLRKKVLVEHLGSVKFTGSLWINPNNFFTDTSIDVEFTCDSEYCRPNPTFQQFFDFMRTAGYDECLIERYYSYTINPELRAEMYQFLLDKPIGYEHGDTVIFYDVIPTDANVTYNGLDIGEASDCVQNGNFPDFCQEITSADYQFVEDHWRKTFGIDLKFRYERVELSYLENFGEPLWNGQQWQFNVPLYVSQALFENSNIVHFALQTWQGAPVRQIDGGGFTANLYSEPNTAFGMLIYSHEWGHAQGLGHTFVVDQSYTSRTYFTMDGVMSNTYQAETNAIGFDPMDPIERYVFEPSDPYLDNDNYARAYSDGIIQTSNFNGQCPNIDPAVSAFELESQTNDNFRFKATLNNFGSVNASYVDVSLYQGITPTQTLSNRTYECLKSNTEREIYFTIAKNEISDNIITIRVDPGDKVTDEEEGNNTLILDDISTSIIDNSENQNIEIHPNPTSDIVLISASKNLKFEAQLYSSYGVLLENHITAPLINLSSYSPGVYFINILNLNTNLRTVMKVVKL